MAGHHPDPGFPDENLFSDSLGKGRIQLFVKSMTPRAGCFLVLLNTTKSLEPQSAVCRKAWE